MPEPVRSRVMGSDRQTRGWCVVVISQMSASAGNFWLCCVLGEGGRRSLSSGSVPTPNEFVVVSPGLQGHRLGGNR